MVINEILSKIAHRPYALPQGDWQFYQEWNRALFMHWRVPVEALQPLVPAAIEIDSFAGEVYVSLVAFTMEKIRPRYLPAVSCISNFHEVNLRTYVEHNGKAGVYFLSIEAAKSSSVWIANLLSGLPYEKARISRSTSTYTSNNLQKGNYLNLGYTTGKIIEQKSAFDVWLTERYCLYVDKGGAMYRYDIHHLERELKQLNQLDAEIDYNVGKFPLNNVPDSLHFSEGVKVISWKKEQLNF